MNVTFDPAKVKFDENGLVPAIIQDAVSKEVLTLAYMNQEALSLTISKEETWLYSRSRRKLWHKGETSGNVQKVTAIHYDCDGDAILVQVIPMGPACHRGTYSCFDKAVTAAPDRFSVINWLESVVARREAERPEGSYTTYLFTKGLDKILKKVGEESAEVIIAAKNRSADELRHETADLLYHLLVLLREQKLPLDEVLRELEERNVKNGKSHGEN
ncbi:MULTISPECIES: bifunctional phosphoribosyl-AMP cyclohydrolase/phosphoribosyl-ATP diphosphatase HisIE [unclassified Thermoactinomyces]|uniref:bifunctional phosphoribosyl-AMP cyclohydrolase/phosphoribosyl-ATP diphosphatase HisIE n=1 Tax=unclassified Thermoactinomyces TaxID=2634588 RepID=UPI0018DBACC9|nr:MULTISPECIES: bifunctional phosphoribosyl-AMP cyclohydrolase/phosphoribosyl-ATP diphosphatase HisIE [unclassified Thermoactinomyces]MBH8598694.1 bifunctional phosphoribosyl-AMP cyclohydrolase/phosphoribosyl-ATP diphosphatase HisIE [Thermoactinomyces sp. CICC 10523]MBH8605047.1 bifunctional phosphoribosyl-AMP cyclohydrolase/phosphoribosyl-ATP diphosphatase HisIE [Thermoactinomyces sp. CICC 10522]MBH8606303.1 bifunctional phosphoribosyl-AMP cyclohydrolase/phosphoribosyl-ATP diphosphatase HisIE 